MKKSIFFSRLIGHTIVLIITICMFSCVTSSTFIKQTKNVDGDYFIRADTSYQVLIDACKYGIKKAGLRLDKEERLENNKVALYATLGSSLQSAGQYVKITIIGEGGRYDKQISTSYFISVKRAPLSVAEDLYAIQRNIETYAKNYLVAAMEGINMTDFSQ